MASNAFQLTVRRGPEQGKSFSLSSDSLTVGRDPMADIVLSDPEVSRQHARLMRTASGYSLQDLGSTNGTFIDGKRLAGEPVELQPGVVVTMGSNVTLRYEAAPDPLATVVSSESDFDFPEDDSEESGFEESDVQESDVQESGFRESEDDLFGETVEPTENIFPTPGVQEVPQGSSQDVFEEDEATSVEFPPIEEPQEFAAAQEEEEDEGWLPSFEEDSFETPDDERTVLDMEASSFSYETEEGDEDELPQGVDEIMTPAEQERAQQGPSDELPSFDDEALPSFDAEPKRRQGYQPQPGPVDRSPPPPPPPAPPEKGSNRNRKVIIAAIIGLLLLCCCCLLLYVGWYYGDALLYELQIQ